MQLAELLSFLNNTSFFNQIEPSKIPNIDLYMDQVLTFMDESLEDYKKKPNDKLLTKSMINNYVKNSLIPKPENKKYSPQHIIALIYIFYFKQILSLDDIKALSNTYTNKHFNLNDMTKLYDTFLELEKKEVENLEAELKSLVNDLYNNNLFNNFDDTEKQFLLVLLLTSRANTYKTVIEKLLKSTD